MKPWVIAALLISGLAWGQARQCYRPVMPPPCEVQKDTQKDEYMRCLVVDRLKLLDYIRAMAIYNQCAGCAK